MVGFTKGRENAKVGTVFDPKTSWTLLWVYSMFWHQNENLVPLLGSNSLCRSIVTRFFICRRLHADAKCRRHSKMYGAAGPYKMYRVGNDTPAYGTHTATHTVENAAKTHKSQRSQPRRACSNALIDSHRVPSTVHQCGE